MRHIFTLTFILISFSSLFAQKMLLIERANRAKTTKLYVGDYLHFRLKGREDYWYHREITDLLPESKTLMLDNFAVRLDSISQIKVRRKVGARIAGGALFSFGATLTLATVAGRYLYNDKDVNAPKLFSMAAISLGAGWWLSKPRKLKLGNKHRLRIIEVKFPDPIIPVYPGKS
ncbi:MAG: hypothetical protein JNJ57_03180 [Saprospiraceae bacterium]|nr:hypothetical protein [Saprospiraceae bacterium]